MKTKNNMIKKYTGRKVIDISIVIILNNVTNVP